MAGNQVLIVFLWFTGAALIALVGFYIVVAVRRWAQREEPVVTFTFQELREMRGRGEITDQEFVVMRAKLLSELDLDAEDTPPPPRTAVEPPPHRPPDDEPRDEPQDPPGPPA